MLTLIKVLSKSGITLGDEIVHKPCRISLCMGLVLY